MARVHIFWEDIGKLATVLAGPKNVDILVPDRYVFGHFPESALKSGKEFPPEELFHEKLIFYSEDQKILREYARKIAKCSINIARTIDVPEKRLIEVVSSIQAYLNAKAEAEKQITDFFYQIKGGG
ncbi:Uncharacterised protein [uncultured archaeon]|nr:Uncharacterised protein [uncultured archaeon]